MQLDKLQRTIVSPATNATYYVGEDEDMLISGYYAKGNSLSFNNEGEEYPCMLGDLSDVEVTVFGAYTSTRFRSGLVSSTEKLNNFYRPAHRSNSHRILVNNFTAYDVHVVDRHGVRYTEPPQQFPPEYSKRSHNNCVVVREEYYFETKSAIKKCLDAMVNARGSKGIVANRIIEQLTQVETKYALGCALIIEYVITDAKLLDHVTIYHTNTDRIISVAKDPSSLVHPCSPDHVPAPLINGPSGDKDMFVNFRYVSKDPEAKSLFVKVAGQVLRLRPCRASGDIIIRNLETQEVDSTLEEYILVTMQQQTSGASSLAAPGSLGPAKITARPYVLPIDDHLEKYGIYTNESDATKEFNEVLAKERYYEAIIAGLKIDRQNDKRDYDTLENQRLNDKMRSDKIIDELKLENRRLIRDHQDDLRDKEVLIEELKRNNAQRLEEAKALREDKVAKTKTSSEYVKMGFTLLTGVMALIPLYFKIRANIPVPSPV